MVAIAWAILLCGMLWDVNQTIDRKGKIPAGDAILVVAMFCVFVVVSIIELRR